VRANHCETGLTGLMPIQTRPRRSIQRPAPVPFFTHSVPDPNLEGSRILRNLVETQINDIDPDYFTNTQSECTPWMRQQVATWLLEVCEEEDLRPPTFPQAIQIFDRFLSNQAVSASELQLLAATCLFIASKVRESVAIPISTCVLYTDESVTVEQIQEMELIILVKLRWDVLSVTPSDSILPILQRIRLSEEVRLRAKKRAQILVDLAALESSLLHFSPTIVAASCVIISLKDVRLRLGRGSSVTRFVARRTQLNYEDIARCHQNLRSIVARWRSEQNENTPQQVNQVWF